MSESNNKSTGELKGDSIIFPEYMSTGDFHEKDFHEDCIDLSKYNTTPLSEDFSEESMEESEEDCYKKPVQSFLNTHNEFVTHNHEVLYRMINLLIESGYDEILLNVEDFDNINLQWLKSEFGTKYIEVDNN